MCDVRVCVCLCVFNTKLSICLDKARGIDPHAGAYEDLGLLQMSNIDFLWAQRNVRSFI